MAQDWRQTRLYTRYPFSAAAEIVSSGAQMPSLVVNISFGGCRLLSERPLPVGTAITLTIRTPTDAFEATAKVAYSSKSDAGVMFDKVSPQSLLVLRKWISAASEAMAQTSD